MRKLFAALLFVSLFLAACGGAASTTLAEQASQITALEGRIAALEAQLAAAPTASTGEHAADVPAPAFQVAVAQYVMDTAGFHAMDESLNETMTVDPSFLSAVNRVAKVVAQAPWPEALHDQAAAFGETLTAFAAALEADDAEAAAGLAAELHEVQHDFSHAIDEWLGAGGDHAD